MACAGLCAAWGAAAEEEAGADPILLPAAPAGHMDFSADSVEFVPREGGGGVLGAAAPAGGVGPQGLVELSTAAPGTLLKLEGHVVLKETTWTIRAGEILVDLDTRTAAVSKGLEMDDGTSVVFGDSGFFDLAAQEGRLKGARAGYAPWRISAAQADIFSDRRVLFHHARFTSCDHPQPDYHIRASEVRLKPQKYLWAWNPVFYIRNVPVFYSPFLWKSLREKRLVRTRVSPGYDQRNGAFARTMTLFNVAPSLYGKLYLDYYGAQGPAFGSELQYHASEDGRGVLYGSRIRENHSGQERWAVLGDAYRTIRSSYAFQARLQAQSDPDFNNDYSRSNAFRVTPDLINGAALVRRTAQSTTRVSYSRLDTSSGSGGYARQSESMPRIDFQTASMGLRGSPWLTTFSMFADNSFQAAHGFLQRSAGASAETTRTLRLMRGMSLTPKLSFGETYLSRHDDPTSFGSIRTFQDTFVGNYLLGGDLRFRSPFGFLDAQYAFNRRLKPDTLQDDAGAMDRGLQQSLLTLQDTLLPRPGVVLRFGTGYDFRSPRGQDISFERRVQPFFADLNWFAGRAWQFSVRDEYQLAQGNRALLVQADWGERSGNFAGFGMTHTIDHAESYLAAIDAGWSPSSGSWRVAGALRFDLRSTGGARLDSVQAFEKEISLVKNLHDFHTRVLFRVRPGGVKEVTFRVELLSGLETARKIVKQGWENEWFPWRKRQSEDSDSR